MAAVLACGERAVLSHRSAAALWGTADEHPRRVDVTLWDATNRKRPGVEIHSGTALTASDVTVRDGVPCTALPRTLLDLASLVDERALARALDRAETLRLFDLKAVGELLGRSRGMRGAGRLAHALDRYRDPDVTPSVAEERLLALIMRAGLPRPATNVWLPLPEGGGYRPDFLWREERLIVEVDGRTYHARRGAFTHDRKRDRRLALAGFHTVRYTASEVLKQPARVAAELAQLLARNADYGRI